MSEQNLHNLLMGGNQSNPGNKMQFPSSTNARGYTSHREQHASGDVVGREHHDVGGGVGSQPTPGQQPMHHGLRNMALAGGAAYLANRYMKNNPGQLGSGQPGGVGGQPGGGKLLRNLGAGLGAAELYRAYKKKHTPGNVTPPPAPSAPPPAPAPQIINPAPVNPGGGQSAPSGVDPSQAAAENAGNQANAQVESAAAQGQGGTVDTDPGTGGFRRGGRVGKRYC